MPPVSSTTVSILTAIIITIALAQRVETIDLPPTWSRVGVTVVQNAQASGTHMDAPIYIAANLTWQVKMHMLPAPNAVLIPLIQDLTAEADRSSATFPSAECTGYVTVCCLRRLERHFANAELSAYTDFLQLASYDKYETCAKAPTPSESSASTLVDMPATQTFARSMFPAYLLAGSAERPRVWVSDAQAGVYTIEFPDEMLDSPWLTSASLEFDPITGSQAVFLQDSSVNTDMSDVVNRLMTIRIALVHRTPTPQLLLTLSEHRLLFRAATRDLDKPAQLLHVAVFAPCAGQKKPPNALWRADILHNTANDTDSFATLVTQVWWDSASRNLLKCLWFCKPGYFLYPSVTDFYHALILPETEQNTQCIAVPRFGAEVELTMSAHIRVDIDDSVLEHTARTCAEQLQSSVTSTREVALAFSMLALQEGIPSICGVEASSSAWLLRASSIAPAQTSSDTNTTTTSSASDDNITDITPLETVTISMDISLALFTSDLENSARAQQDAALQCMNGHKQIQAAKNQIARTTQIQLSTNTRSQCAGITLNALRVRIWFTVSAIQTRMRYPPREDQTSVTIYWVITTWGLVFLLSICYGCSVMYARAHRGPVGLWRAHRLDRGVLNT